MRSFRCSGDSRCCCRFRRGGCLIGSRSSSLRGGCGSSLRCGCGRTGGFDVSAGYPCRGIVRERNAVPAVFDINVRLAYPEFTVFDQISDIDTAVRYVISHADKYECDPSKVYIAGHSSGGVLAVAEALLCVDPLMRFDYGIEERNYIYRGVITDCGLLHFYKSSIAYWGMRNMCFPKGYKKDKRYGYLVFEKNTALSKLPMLAIMTNQKDVLRKMTFHFDEVLSDKCCEHRLFMYGEDGHTGIIFKPYTERNIEVLKQVKEYLS